jgi:ABC-type multidrug transport system ATPase subunit
MIETRPAPTQDAPPRALPELLALHDVAKSYGGRPVLAGLELVVGRGELIGVGGANGIGKTTLLRICCGLIAADAGVVWLDGLHPRRDRAAFQRRVGFLAAGDRGLYARLTLRRHLELWGRVSLLEPDRYRRAIERTIERLALAEFEDRRMDRLSMGQRQRVRLAMAFMHEPDLVLLDEPLNSLDERGAELLRGCLAEATGRGGAVIWCAPTIGTEAGFDRSLLLEAGRLHEVAR